MNENESREAAREKADWYEAWKEREAVGGQTQSDFYAGWFAHTSAQSSGPGECVCGHFEIDHEKAESDCPRPCVLDCHCAIFQSASSAPGLREALEGDVVERAKRVLTDMRRLEFAGLLQNTVHNYPNLRHTVNELFAALHIDSCGLCCHRRTEHFAEDGVTPKYCCDGCDGFVWADSRAALAEPQPSPWTEINSVDDLPKEDGSYLVSVTVGPFDTRVIPANFVVNDEIFISGWLFNYEAWQPLPAPFTPQPAVVSDRPDGGESRSEFERDRMGQTGADNAAKLTDTEVENDD